MYEILQKEREFYEQQRVEAEVCVRVHVLDAAHGCCGCAAACVPQARHDRQLAEMQKRLDDQKHVNALAREAELAGAAAREAVSLKSQDTRDADAREERERMREYFQEETRKGR